jgi:prefoldin subunit 2
MQKSGQESEQEVSAKYRQMQQETSALVSKILEIEEEKKEHELVMDTMKSLDDTRKCWRLVNGVLFEKTKAQVIPEIETQVANMVNLIKQLSEAVALKKQEIFKLEQQYESVMKQAKDKQGQKMQQSEVKSGGVLV